MDYVCVDNLGRLILPNRLSHNFIKIIRKNNLKHIRFHDLRHSCASNGVPMKQIQEWLGHADFGTTANIYSHLDYKTKQNSANTISNVFNFNSKKEENEKTNEIDKTKGLEEKIAKLEEQLKSQQEDEEYKEWLKEKEMRKKKKQKDFEM